MKKFSIIIPTLNEEINIVPLLQRISGMAQVFNYAPEIIFVDDGSTDATCQRIKCYRGKYEVKLIQRQNQRGLSGAVAFGAKHASYDNIVVMDADLSHEPESIPELISPLITDKYDMTIGSRYILGGSTNGWPVHRKVISRLASLPAHFITGIEDPLSGFFSIKKKYLLDIKSNTSGFKIALELLRLHGDLLRVKEIPINFNERYGGQSKMGLSVITAYFLQLLSCFGIQFRSKNVITYLLIGVFAALFDAQVFLFLVDGNIDIITAHIASFLLSGHLLYFFGISNMLSADLSEDKTYFLSTYRHMLFVLIPALFIRGGILSMMFKNEASLEMVVYAIGLFTSVTWLLFITRLNTLNFTKPLPRGSALVAVIAFSLLLRAIYLGTTELIQEEAYYWNYAQHMAYGYLDHPPVVAVFIWLGTQILGDTEIGVRLFSYLCWFVTALFCYLLTRRLYNARAATYAVLLVAILPIFFGASLVMTPDAPLLACWSATLYFLYRALIDKSRKSWIGAGAAFGLGLISKYTIALLAPATLLFLLVDRSSRRWLKTPMPYLSLALAVLLFTPVIWWNMENNWASFLFQSQSRITDVPMFATHKLIISLLLLLTPAGVIVAALALLPWKLQESPKKWAQLRLSRSYLFTLLMALIPFLVFFFFSLSKEVKLNWTGPIWLITVPFMAHGLLFSIENSERLPRFARFLSASWSKTAISLIFIYGVSLHYLSIGLPGVPYLTNNILLGWDDLASKVEIIVGEVESQNGKRPIIVGMDKYRIASGISYYRSKNIDQQTANPLPLTTGRHLFGMESLMFSYWHPSMLFSHQDLVVVADSRNWLHPDYFRRRAMKIGEIKEFIIEKQGKTIATYYYRILNGYLPFSPKKVAMNNEKALDLHWRTK